MQEKLESQKTKIPLDEYKAHISILNLHAVNWGSLRMLSIWI